MHPVAGNYYKYIGYSYQHIGKHFKCIRISKSLADMDMNDSTHPVRYLISTFDTYWEKVEQSKKIKLKITNWK